VCLWVLEAGANPVPAMTKEIEMRFKKLPMRLQQRWWEWTCYGKHPASDELMWAIEAINPELAVYLAQGDAERIERTWGEKKTQRLSKLSAEEETKILISALRSCGGEEGADGDICADMVKVIMAWRRGNLAPRWEVPALRALCKDFDPPDEYCG
jgi:hypothetical protein